MKKEINKKIKNLLLQSPNYVRNTNFFVNNYREINELWMNFKSGQKYENKFLNNILTFHECQTNHIILFYDLKQIGPFLMCKIDNQYSNIVLNDNTKFKNKSNFIAIYS